MADLVSVLWSGADVLRGKMDANEYKTYLLGLIFYKYLSDKYLVRVYDLLNDEMPDDLEQAQQAFEEAMESEDKDELLAEIKETLHYTLDADMTYTSILKAAANNRFAGYRRAGQTGNARVKTGKYIRKKDGGNNG